MGPHRNAEADPAALIRNMGELQRETLAARDVALDACAEQGQIPDAFLSSPCLSCLKRFDKVKWSSSNEIRV